MRTLPRLATFVFASAVGLSLASAATAEKSAAATAAPDSLFDYDRSAPLDVREVMRETRAGALIRDVTFAAGKDLVAATIVAPEKGGGSLAGILYVHWLGEPATTNRTEFLVEATALTGQGIVSVLVEAMWAEEDWYKKRIPEEDYAHSIQQVIELRRALDLLLAQPGIDPKRIAYVGHDFGAMYGAVMGAVDRRPTTYVLMAGTPHFIDWFLFAQKPKSLDDYRKQLASLDPVNFVGRLAPAPVFFQFAAHDEYVSAAASAEFYGAAQPRKQAAHYDAGHDLRNPAAAADRVTWLIRLLAKSE
ncbi:alpha/beta hydrolase family protein [Opitutus terrae]|uniref:Dipeptidyl aminopeptidase/acylaminoacyl-peptidase-like protein n=1 Tax=Opitutus terrae (strain DSM 11246 / JCM 15787 / PB90-1) TaxID=452637 RepID=B1ZSK9_OPITP|nr:alpha/beta hydrolase [Opitutus terrae]ACB73866.1 dipeptidyl aminopeptidase/acylaminoacyl-peptidase-like protein [Opitutus terrae PB90-1]